MVRKYWINIVPTSNWMIAGVFIVMAGCSGAMQTSSPPPADASESAHGSETKDSNREQALEHFIQGSMYDIKGEYAKAILEYQDALSYHEDPAIYHALAKDYLHLGKHALAARMAEKSVEAVPENTSYRETLADVYVAAFEVDKAVAQYETIVQLDSNSVKAWYNLARLYQSNKPLKALELYRSITDRFGGNWDVYLQIAEIYSNLGDEDKAAEAYKEMLSIDPANRRLKMILAVTYSRSGNYDEALRLYDELLELNPLDIAIHSAIAGIYIKRKEYGEAANHYDSILDQDSVAVESKIRIGEMFYDEIRNARESNSNQIEEDSSLGVNDSVLVKHAESIFERIAKSHPSDWHAYWYLGALGSMTGDDSLAVLNLRRVIDLASWNKSGWILLSSIYFQNGNFEELADLLESALQVLPEDFDINLNLGVTYSRLRRDEDAVRVLETAVQLDSEHVPALGALALSYDNLKRHEDSDRIYEQALKIDPINHLILNNYAYSLADRGIQLDRALKMAKEAVRQQPKNSSYLDTLGWVYFRLKEYEKAHRYIEEAIEAGDASAVIHEHLGDIYSKLNRQDLALEYWQKAYELDSTNEALRDKINSDSR